MVWEFAYWLDKNIFDWSAILKFIFQAIDYSIIGLRSWLQLNDLPLQWFDFLLSIFDLFSFLVHSGLKRIVLLHKLLRFLFYLGDFLLELLVDFWVLAA